jgi:Cytochrome C oxidase, cbb3-type, subunit III
VWFMAQRRVGAASAQTPWVAPQAEKARKSVLPWLKGQGEGAAAVALNPKPADWTSAKVQSESHGEIFWKISNGRGAMPPWKHLVENDRWALIRYIHSLGGTWCPPARSGTGRGHHAGRSTRPS